MTDELDLAAMTEPQIDALLADEAALTKLNEAETKALLKWMMEHDRPKPTTGILAERFLAYITPPRKKYKIKTIGYVPAAVGTRLVVFSCDWDADAHDQGIPVYLRREIPVVAWAIRRNNMKDGLRWTAPITTEAWSDEEHHVVIHPDGRMEFTVPYADEEFTGTTLDEFAAFTDNEYRATIKSMQCLDCGKSLLIGNDSPMLKNEIWRSIVPGDGKGMLCRAHMEERLGRKLTADDMKVMP